jgi:hypothetical protein
LDTDANSHCHSNGYCDSNTKSWCLAYDNTQLYGDSDSYATCDADT